MKGLFYFLVSLVVVKVFFPVAAGGIGEAFIKLIAIINHVLDSITT